MPPSLKVIVPVAALLLTVPVSVTDEPKTGVAELALTVAVTGVR